MAERQTNPNVQALSNKIIQEYLTSNLGEESIKIIRAATEEMTDDALAVKCKLKVSEIRTVLNKMHSMRLAEYTRIRDKDTGWYSYIWKINLSGVYGVLDSSMKNEISQLNNRMEENTTVLSYICSKCSKSNVIDFEIASKLAFRCPNCSRKLYEKKNNNEEIATKLGELNTKYSLLQTHIKKIDEIRRLEAEKAAVKAAAFAAAAAEAEQKAKLEKKNKAQPVANRTTKANTKAKQARSKSVKPKKLGKAKLFKIKKVKKNGR